MARGRWVGVALGMGIGRAVPSAADYRGSGQRRQLPQRSPGQSPGRKRILAYFKGHMTLFLYLGLYDKT